MTTLEEKPMAISSLEDKHVTKGESFLARFHGNLVEVFSNSYKRQVFNLFFQTEVNVKVYDKTVKQVTKFTR